jgi:hypothetical protein
MQECTLKFVNKKINVSGSTLEYILQTCFIHLDDRNEEIQKAMFKFLKFAADEHIHAVQKEAVSSLPKQKFPRLCEELIKYIDLKLENQEGQMEEK